MALKRGKLKKDPDGYIDTKDPLNATYLAGNRAKVEPVEKKQKVKPQIKSPIADQRLVTDIIDENNDDEADLQEVADERLKLTIASRKQKEADTRLKEIKSAQLKGALVPRDLVRRKFSQFDVALKTNFRDAPRRIAAQVHAIALSGTVQDVEKYLEREISDAIKRTVEAAQKEELI